MIFHEIYGLYYKIAGIVMNHARSHPITRREIGNIVSQTGFGDSILTIPEAITNGKWGLLDTNNMPVLKHKCAAPISDLEIDWLKEIQSDPKYALISNESIEAASNVSDSSPYVYYDRISNDKWFLDETYRSHFSAIKQAIYDKTWLVIRFNNRFSVEKIVVCLPDHFEYSCSEDQFRVISYNHAGYPITLNMSSILEIQPIYNCSHELKERKTPQKDTITFVLFDEKGALDRAMRQFSDLEKVTSKLSDKEYSVDIHYFKQDETEIITRILSLGTSVKIISPIEVVNDIKSRIERQKQFF